MNLIVITPEEILPDEVQLWEALFQSGLQRLHIRKPRISISQLRDMLSCLPEKHHHQVIIHQHHKLVFSSDGRISFVSL